MKKIKPIPTVSFKSLKLKSPTMIAVIAVVAVLAIISLVYAGYTMRYRGKIYPRTRIGTHDFGKKTPEEAKQALADITKDFPPEMQVLLDSEAKNKLALAELGVQYQLDETAQALMNVGRSQRFGPSLWEITRSMFGGNKRQLLFTIDADKTATSLAKTAATLGTKAQEANVVLNNDGTLSVSPSKEGYGITTQDLENGLRITLAQLDTEIKLTSHPITPIVTEEQLHAILDSAKSILAKAPLTLTVNEKKGAVDAKTIFSWLKYAPSPNTSPSPPAQTSRFISFPVAHAQQNLSISFDTEAIKTYLADFSNTVNQPAQNAQLSFIDGAVKVVKPHVDGQKLKIDESITLITTALTNPETTGAISLALPIETDAAKIQENTIASLGIKEVIGRGETNFRGSPSNRVHNITTGTRFLNGAIIAPNEEFSTLKMLGDIDGSTGYLPELVIKENRTTPEFGGGLCQVSTTLFRAVLNAGLKVTVRRNHSYRVSYYEPPVGLDATIYQPTQDFKFLNDSPGYILVQARIEGTKVVFDLYGTRDGRSSTLTAPVVTDITEPPPPEYTETDTLKKGETKQTEKAHQGAKAVVVYTVMRDGKEIHKQTFRSTYKAWQARYLVGTREESPAPAPSPTPTPETTPTPTP